MAVLTRAELLRPRIGEPVPVPELGGEVLLRALPASVSLALDDGQESSGYERAVRLVMACVVDEAGQPIFTEADRPVVDAYEPSVLVRLANEIARRARVAAASVGNSKASLGDGSPSA